MSIAQNNSFPENGEEEEEEEEGSDSEGLNSYAATHDGDYRPTSALSDDDVDVESDPSDEMPTRINGQDLGSHLGEFHSFSFQTHLPSNGHYCVENGVSNLSLTSDEDEEEEEEEEEEEARIRRLSDLAIIRAFREDENRRNAPITPENHLRIVNAMQRISFPGFPPDWADHVPKDQWMDRLRRLREPTSPRN